MSEKEFNIEPHDPLVIYGSNDQHIELLRQMFPKLKIIARGEIVKIIGDDEEMNAFTGVFERILELATSGIALDAAQIRSMVLGDFPEVPAETSGGDDVLVFGRSGMQIKARTVNQRRMVESCNKNDLTFAIGPAGTGKTYTAVALAVRALKNKEVRRIILTRPAVEAGENLGFLPGDLKEKLDPYLQPLYDALWDMIPQQKLEQYMEDRIIEIAPLAFMRGRTLDNAFVILDEAQNSTPGQMKMFLTRMGKSARFIVTGDVTQIDLPGKQISGLVHAIDALQGIEGINFIFLDHQDIVRHKLVTRILNAYEQMK
jgi:phosphate starvation-inducible PhoH-like protein